MYTHKKTARIAGLLYLIVVLTGFFCLLYIPSTLQVKGDDAATVNNIKTHETLFRVGIVAGIVCYLSFLFLPLVLYKLLNPVNKFHAIAMVVLAVISVPITLINLLNKFAVLTLIGKAGYLSAFEAGELQTQVMLNLDYYSNGVQLASIFWGLWLFPFGYLVYRSGMLPKVLGIFLMAGCIGYIINFVGEFLCPSYAESGIAGYVSLPSAIGEIGTCLWLLIMGAKEQKKSVPAI